jgi:hypothetical protein
MLLVGGGEGLKGRGKDLGELLGSLGPINRDLAKINSEVATRKTNLANLVHNLGGLTGRLGTQDQQIADLIDSSNSALSSIADQNLNVTRATALLPGTLQTTRDALHQVSGYAKVLKPTLASLRPFARNLTPINQSLRNLSIVATPAVRDQIRPFTQAARGPVKDLKPAADQLTAATPNLTKLAAHINTLGNMAAYNPNGAEPPGTPGRDEGYLYWLGWLAHVGNSVFSAQDGNGIYRRIYLTAGCDTITSIAGSTPLSPLITGFQNLLSSITPGAPC